MEAHLKLALPISSVQMNIGKLFGITDTTSNLSVDTIDGSAMFVWKGEDSPAPKNFSLFNMDGKIVDSEFSVNIYDQLKGVKYVVKDPETGLPVINPLTGEPIVASILLLEEMGLPIDTLYLPKTESFDSTITFSLALPLDSINKAGSPNRVDSVKFTSAHFGLTINRDNFEGITTEWIDSIVVDLSENFDLHNASSRIVLYSSSTSGFYFGQELPIDLNDFALVLMKDEKKTPANDNVVDTIHVSASVKYHIPGGSKMVIHNNSGLKCAFSVGNLKPVALWGWFKPSGDMSDEGTYDFNNDWDHMPMFKNAVLPFSRPKIEVSAVTQVAGAIKMHGNYMRSWDKDGNLHEASFNGKQSFDTIFSLDHCADPHGPMDRVSHISLRFDNTEPNGRIDKLFAGGIPKKISYQFLFGFDSITTPQIRIPTDTYVKLSSKITMPLSFGQGARMSHTDTLHNLDISQFKIDSLFGENVKLADSSQIGAILKTEGTIPLRVKLQFRCYDESGNVIKDGDKEFGIFDSDTLEIDPPTLTKNAEGKWVGEPKQLINTATMTKRQLDLFPKAKTVTYTMWIDDKTLEEAYAAGLTDIHLGPDQYLKLTVALTAQLNAAIELNKNNK